MTNRIIRFRGKRKDIGQWEYGYYFTNGLQHGIIYGSSFPGAWREVDPETVGQFTGLKNINGEDVCVGDILRYPAKSEWDKTSFVAFEVFFHDGNEAERNIGFQFNRLHFHGNIAGYAMTESFLPKHVAKMETIGNIHDNPELLK